MLREKGMLGAAQSSQLCQINRKSPQNGTKNLL
jgi:hypothetical protein